MYGIDNRDAVGLYPVLDSCPTRFKCRTIEILSVMGFTLASGS